MAPSVVILLVALTLGSVGMVAAADDPTEWVRPGEDASGPKPLAKLPADNPAAAPKTPPAAPAVVPKNPGPAETTRAPSLPSTHAPPAPAPSTPPAPASPSTEATQAPPAGAPPAPPAGAPPAPKLTIPSPTLPAVPNLNDACTEAVKELRKPIAADVPTLRLVLDLILAEYPNDQGVFEARPAAKPAGGKPPPELDWLAALRELKLDTQPELEPARKEAIRITSALRQVAASKRYDKGCDAAKALLDFAFAGTGAVFRDEVGRQIRVMESASLPALIRAALSENTANKALKRYANYQLDRMDRQRPQTVLAQVHDDPLRAEILRAYGQARPQSAVSAVLGECDASSTRVRRNARWAWTQYVTKKPPDPPKRKLKMTGGKESEEEKQLYLTYRELADLEIRKQWPLWMNQPADPQKSLIELTQTLFATLDANRAARWDAELASADQARKEGRIEDATRMYDWILANDPLYGRRLEMVPGYVELAEKYVAERQWEQASRLFRKVEWLGPDALAKAHRPHALLAYAMAGDKVALEQALELLPHDRDLKIASRKQTLTTWKRRLRHGALPGLGAVALVCAAVALWPREKRRTNRDGGDGRSV